MDGGAQNRRAARAAAPADGIRASCLRQVVPLARSLLLMTPLSAGLMVLLVRPPLWAAVLWAAVLVVPAVLVAWRSPPPTAALPVLDRWEAAYGHFVTVNLLTWASALVVLRPPPDQPEVQTAQLLVLVAVGNSLVLLGAFLPRLFARFLVVFSTAIVVGLVGWGIGLNRLLAAAVPVYALILFELQGQMRAATERSVRLALENRLLLQELGVEQERLEREARHDHLTGLLNRAAFLEELERCLATSRADRPVAMGFVDLDHFKQVNDRHGHVVGDRVLALVARRLRSAVRAEDVVARFGGDEFTVLFGPVPDAATARLAGQRITAAFDGPFEVDGLVLRVGVSVGIGLAAGADGDADGLVRLADRAVYAAKAAGRHRVEVLGPVG